MFTKTRLYGISFLLIVVNLILIGIIFVNRFLIPNLPTPEYNPPSEVKGASSSIIFNPNQILTENDFRSKRAFPTEASVQNYLESRNSPLKNYTDQGRRASYWIFNASVGNTSAKWNIIPNINPGIILTFLEKEQSLLSLSGYNTSTDPENRIATAMGYGCPDFVACDDQYKGFANQVNWAAYQLEYNIFVATNPNTSDPFKVNNTITTLDNFNVFLSNSVTASFYRYTPHVYWGNYNVFKIMTAYGWGESSQIYDINEIDSVNLANRQNLLNNQFQASVKIEQIRDLLINPPALGTSSPQIELLQKFLRQEGYFTYPLTTGLYGNITDTALKAYIKDRGTGGNSSSDEALCRDLYTKVWQIGDTGSEVEKLQTCLRKINLFAWPIITGYYGSITEQGLQTARRKLGINNSNQTSSSSSSSSSSQNSSQTSNSSASNSRCSELLNRTNWAIGQENDDVKALQACLRALNLFSFPTNTGYFGPITNTALNAYRGGGSSSSNSSTPSNNCTNLKMQGFRIGNQNDQVRQLQECLRQEGVFSFPTNTGYFGPITNTSLATSLDNMENNFSCEQIQVQPFVENTTSSRVQKLQACMRSAGVFNWANGDTGFFGPVTKNSIVRWRGFYQ